MTTITLEVADELAESIAAVKDRLPEVIALGLGQRSPLPADAYAYVLNFIANGPTPEQLMKFHPNAAMTRRLAELIDKERNTGLSEVEQRELEEYEHIEHLVVMLKARAFPYLVSHS
jgi:hypothetical protein